MLSTIEAAEYKDVHPQSVRIAIRDGRLPAVRKGHMYLIRRQDLDAWTVTGHRPKKGQMP